VDFLAKKPGTDTSAPVSIGIEYKHYNTGKRVEVASVRQLIGASVIQGFDRAMLVTNSRFSLPARELVRRELPLVVELVDLDSLRAWTSRVQRSLESIPSRILSAICDLSQQLARFVAKDPDGLQVIEWRDMERMLAAVFDGLGFSVELTPSSKDEGKDIILQCIVFGEEQSYIVEIKHWRSGQHVGKKLISHFVNVIAREDRKGGLYLATYGYTDNAFEALSEIERHRLRFGEKEKIVGLCQTYVKAESGIWSAPRPLPELLFEETF
jgi:HJR/Mrr/RecB family endonuclease